MAHSLHTWQQADSFIAISMPNPVRPTDYRLNLQEKTKSLS